MILRPYYEDAGIVIYHGDARELLPQIGAADHLITDPPYSEHVHTKARSAKGAAEGKIDQAYALGFASVDDALRAAILGYAASQVARWSLVFSDVESCHLWRDQFPLDYVRTMFWHRLGGAPQFTGDRPAAACEAITVLHPPTRKRWNGGGKQGFYATPIAQVRGGSGTEFRAHTTQKPEQLMAQLIADFTDVGDLIVDPCMGSGTTLAVARRMGRRAIGIDLEATHCATAVARLAQCGLFDAWTDADAREALELSPQVQA